MRPEILQRITIELKINYIWRSRRTGGEGMAEERTLGKSGELTETAPGKALTVEVEELPKAIVRRVVKDKLSKLSSGGGEEEILVNKDALLAFSESTRIFIHYLSATANDICKESKRQTINADDVLKALEEIGFVEFVEPLKASLEEFRKRNEVKRSGVKGKETAKKRKIEDTPSKNGRKE
ncbi:DNA polymerase epsilon subunit 3-like isoform X1 [Zingiber officinale]|uniref:DNA polymerase epsilon subunit 3-like isoform X1 n=1 Tax=Zingiber officinale TaxID=94328 RepID=UPI001C4D337E|nr:DNA polymerase epsilon subunit 3-like isoform X1 [Zingiber officinale]